MLISTYTNLVFDVAKYVKTYRLRADIVICLVKKYASTQCKLLIILQHSEKVYLGTDGSVKSSTKLENRRKMPFKGHSAPAD